MKISIIIPVYNVEKYIIECIESVINQNYSGLLECIIVDDCGEDLSISLVTNRISLYSGSIEFKIIHRNKNGGLSAARNSGIRVATGDYITFLDSDDKLMPDAIKNFASIASKCSDIDLIQGDIFVSSPGEKTAYLAISPALFPPQSYDPSWCASSLLSIIPTTAWGKLIKRDFILSNNLFYCEGILHEDEMWRLQASRYIKSIAFCFNPVYYYRLDNSDSIMHRKDRTQHYLSMLKIAEEVIDNFNINNAYAEISFAMWILSYSKKSAIWEEVTDKRSVCNYIKKLLSKIGNKPEMRIIKPMLIFLRIPSVIMETAIMKWVYKKSQFKIYKNICGYPLS